MHRNPAKPWRLSLVHVRNFYYLLEFSLSTRGERDTIFTMLTVPSDRTTRGAFRRPPTRLASSRFENQLASPSFGSQLTAFFQNHQESMTISSGHDVIRTPETFPIWGFYYDLCDYYILRARAWSPAFNVCTRTCTKPNSSKPNQTEW